MKLTLLCLVGIFLTCVAAQNENMCLVPDVFPRRVQQASEECGRQLSRRRRQECFMSCLLEQLDLLNEDGWPYSMQVADTFFSGYEYHHTHDVIETGISKCVEEAKNQTIASNNCQQILNLRPCLYDHLVENCYVAGRNPQDQETLSQETL